MDFNCEDEMFFLFSQKMLTVLKFFSKVYNRNQNFLVCTLQRYVYYLTEDFYFEFAKTKTLAGLVLLRLSPGNFYNCS